MLMDQLLGGRRPPGYANERKSHNAVVAAVAQGRADWAIAIATVAKLSAMAFLPILPEYYDFLVVESRCSRPAVREFLAALAAPGVRGRIAALGMKFDGAYDTVPEL
jgi:putative molybdopterin biosynthesis protein